MEQPPLSSHVAYFQLLSIKNQKYYRLIGQLEFLSFYQIEAFQVMWKLPVDATLLILDNFESVGLIESFYLEGDRVWKLQRSVYEFVKKLHNDQTESYFVFDWRLCTQTERFREYYACFISYFRKNTFFLFLYAFKRLKNRVKKNKGFTDHNALEKMILTDNHNWSLLSFYEYLLVTKLNNDETIRRVIHIFISGFIISLLYLISSTLFFFKPGLFPEYNFSFGSLMKLYYLMASIFIISVTGFIFCFYYEGLRWTALHAWISNRITDTFQ